MIGFAFLIATVILLFGTRAVTIDIDRATDKFVLRYGGIVFEIRETTIERPLYDLRFVSTDSQHHEIERAVNDFLKHRK